MAKLRVFMPGSKAERIYFWCPGCNDDHCVSRDWEFNGDMERPTFTPSVLTTMTRYGPELQSFSEYQGPHPPVESKEVKCHLFVKDGQVQFCNESWHGLAGQTVPLPDLPDTP